MKYKGDRILPQNQRFYNKYIVDHGYDNKMIFSSINLA